MMIASFAVPLLLAGCSPADTRTTGDTGTTAAVVTGTEPESPPPAPDEPSQEIRSVNWQSYFEALTGDDFLSVQTALYRDFDGDGSEDALVATCPNSGYQCALYVFFFQGGAPKKMFEKTKIYLIDHELGTAPASFIEKTGILSPDDPWCCPSNLTIRTYQWSDADQSFHVTGEWVEDNPDVD